MKAIAPYPLLTALLLGGALLISAKPAAADIHIYHGYEQVRHDRHYDHRGHKKHKGKHYKHSKKHHPKYSRHPSRGAVHHHYYEAPRARHYSHDPAIVVQMPPIVVRLK